MSFQRISFSLTQIEYALAVHKFGHFAKAAKACHVTQPTLSMQIQKLEDDLGVVIFDRSKKPILLTEVGRQLIEQMQAILFETRKIEGIIEESRDQTRLGKLHGKLNLGVIPTISPYLLPLLLPVFEKRFPHIELRISELQTHRIVSELRSPFGEDELDVGLLATPLNLPKIFEHPLFYEPFSVLCRKDHELAQHLKIKYSTLKFHKLNDIWLLEEGHCLRSQILDVCSLSKTQENRRRYQFESGSLETLKRLIDSIGGYTLLPELAGSSIGTHTQLIPFEKPIPAREIGLVYRREHHKNDLIEALGETIIECIPAHLRTIRKKGLEILAVN